MDRSSAATLLPPGPNQEGRVAGTSGYLLRHKAKTASPGSR